MKKLVDIGIGKKLALVLGGCVLLLAGLSGLSIWGFQSMAKSEKFTRDRLGKTLLVDRIARGVGAANVRVRTIISSKKGMEQERSELLEIRKGYLASIAEFKATA